MRQLNDGGGLRPARLGVALAAVLSLGACADLTRVVQGSDYAVNPESPVAPAVVAASNANPPYPRLDKVPPVPTDIRPAAAYKDAVIQEIEARRAMKRLAAALETPPPDTGAFVASANAVLNAGKIEPVAADQAAQSEAFAEAARKAATPPSDHPSSKSAPAPVSPVQSAPKPTSQQP